MARVARVLVDGAVYHVTARGNRKQQVFFEADDYDWYLGRLALCSEAFGLELLGWCLMPNHVHLLVRELQQAAMARTMRSVQSAYAKRLNLKMGELSGHAWQGRFYSAPRPSGRIWTVLRYIELNPVRAGLVQEAEAFCWSTARYHSRPIPEPRCLSLRDWIAEWNSRSWTEALATGVNGEEEMMIRRATTLGRWPQDGAMSSSRE